jgi:hypothetical protein
LTENPKFSVLVLEAGVRYVIMIMDASAFSIPNSFSSNEGVISSTIPFLINDLLLPNIYEWSMVPTSLFNKMSLILPNRLHHDAATRLEWASSQVPTRSVFLEV